MTIVNYLLGETSLVDQGLSNNSYDMQHAILEPAGVPKSVSATVTNSLDASLIIAPNMALNPVLSYKNNIVVSHQATTQFFVPRTSCLKYQNNLYFPKNRIKQKNYSML